MTQEQALLPCPFCGGAASIEHTEDNRYGIGCSTDEDGTCIGYQSLTTFPRRKDAIEAWNKRPAASSSRPAAPTGTGWKPLPATMTREMLDAARVRINGDVTALYRGTDDSIECFYSGIFEAAPTPPDSPAGVVKALETVDVIQVGGRTCVTLTVEAQGFLSAKVQRDFVGMAKEWKRQRDAALAGITRDGGGE